MLNIYFCTNVLVLTQSVFYVYNYCGDVSLDVNNWNLYRLPLVLWLFNTSSNIKDSHSHFGVGVEYASTCQCSM